MESEIKIKASTAAMNEFFEENAVCSVRYFKSNGNGTFTATIRHSERESHLHGTYTIPQIITELLPNGIQYYSDAAIHALAEYIEASDTNALDSDEAWPAGFRTVEEKMKKLRQYFSLCEFDAIIINKDSIRDVLRGAGLLVGGMNEQK